MRLDDSLVGVLQSESQLAPRRSQRKMDPEQQWQQQLSKQQQPRQLGVDADDVQKCAEDEVSVRQTQNSRSSSSSRGQSRCRRRAAHNRRQHMALEHSIGTPVGADRKEMRMHNPLPEMDDMPYENYCLRQPQFDVEPKTPIKSSASQSVTLEGIWGLLTEGIAPKKIAVTGLEQKMQDLE